MTQMADVADALGVAKGTIYGYVESKEALLDTALRFADGHPVPGPSSFPWKTPRAGATVAYVRERLASEAKELVLIECSADGAAQTRPRSSQTSHGISIVAWRATGRA